MNHRAIAGLAAAALGAAIPVATVLIATPSATAADHVYCPLGTQPITNVVDSHVICADANTINGIHAGVKVADLVCVRVDALVPEKDIAKAKVRVPCPKHVIVPTEPGGTEPPVVVVPVEPPATGGDNGGAGDDTPVAPAPDVVPAHLPVTG